MRHAICAPAAAYRVHHTSAMDPTNPRWDTSDVRYRRQKLFWSVLAGSVAAVAASTMIVVSCLGGGRARHEPSDVTIVETPAAAPSPPSPGTTIVINPVTPVPVATAIATVPAADDRAGAVDERPGTTTVTSAPIQPIQQRAITTAPPAVTVATPAVATAPSVATAAPVVRAPAFDLPPRPAAPAAGAAATPSAPSLSPTTAPQANSTQAAPSPTQGAGAFITDAPPNAGSSFESNPEAGAGAFPGPR